MCVCVCVSISTVAKHLFAYIILTILLMKVVHETATEEIVTTQAECRPLLSLMNVGATAYHDRLSLTLFTTGSIGADRRQIIAFCRRCCRRRRRHRRCSRRRCRCRCFRHRTRVIWASTWRPST